MKKYKNVKYYCIAFTISSSKLEAPILNNSLFNHSSPNNSSTKINHSNACAEVFIPPAGLKPTFKYK